MRLCVYYILHTFKNQLRKLFKTWVAVVIGVALLFGLILGIGAGFLANLTEDDTDPPSETVVEAPDDEIPDGEEAALDPAEALEIFELAAGGVILFVLLLHVLTGEKSGAGIFLSADANLLFAAPLKPQSVLMFRLIMQMGAIVAASLYLLFQIPNLCMNLGLGIWAALGVIVCWLFTVIFSKLLSVLCYTAASTNDKIKRLVRPVTFGIPVAAAAAFYLYWKSGSLSLYGAAKAFFNAPVTRCIPIWGWLKGAAVSAVSGHAAVFVLYLAGMVLAIVLLTFFIWKIKADFYEEALAKSAEQDERLKAAADSGAPVVKRKKERSEKLPRDGFHKGQGATVFFHKALYNRRRFAHFGVFTGTSLTYLFIGVCVSLALKFMFHTESLAICMCVLGILVFFRSLGNPVAQDTKQASFGMIPDPAFKKLFFSLSGGTVCCLFDLIPAVFLSAVILRANPLAAALYLLLCVSVDFYSSNVGAFIDLSLPTSLDQKIRNAVQILFVYFGLLPVVAVMAVGFVMGRAYLAAAGGVLLCLGVGFLFSAVTPVFLKNGRK